MNRRSQMEEHERAAVAAALGSLVADLGNQTNAAEALGVSQPAIAKAINHRVVGREVTQSLLDYLKVSMPDLLARYGDPYPARARALALAREAGVSEATCAAIRRIVLAVGEDRSPAWWLRGALNAELGELITVPAAKLETDRVRQQRVAKGAASIEADAKAHRDRESAPRQKTQKH